MKLIRQILEYVEANGNGEPLDPPDIPDHTPIEVNYHIGLCAQAGYLEVTVVSGKEERHRRYVIYELTWAGHEELAAFRGC